MLYIYNMKTRNLNKRFLVFDTPTGKYKIKVVDVVNEIVDFYMKEKNYIKTTSDYKKEWENIIEDKNEIIDWLLFDSSWDEWKEKAILVDSEIKVNENSFWCDEYDFEIIEE